MKKNTIKAFTLVEMLIVIVIIGILIASLMPRMQSAQWRARDVARKNDLSQIQTAIITSQTDKWEWPQVSSGRNWMNVNDIKTELLTAWMSSVPTDPNGSNEFTGLGGTNWVGGKYYTSWNYAYMVTKRSSIKDGWFILMAKTETEWGSNWVWCGETNLEGWYITGGANGGTDLADIKLCTKFTKWDECKANQENGECKYKDINQLRYILMY